ncbi:MAG: SusD/RagB family nutrient-binding outer membrane lipoprotein [Bradyrhizobiaceae bacterium]|nr:SusD/RagB family nutrient-binding outer membrane lipoprotein [Bradyrhizobiaceae bacterium]
MYRLETKYTAGVAQNYVLKEVCHVVRTHSDSSKKTYDREVTHYLTIRTIESINGLSKVVANLDSVTYHFSGDNGVVEYDSQKDITPKTFPDLNAYIGPLNRTFTMTVNSYGEVNKIEGDDIDFWRDYIRENSPDLDSITTFLWEESLSDDNLKHMADIQKRMVPGLKVGVDSTWKYDLALRVNGVMFNSPVTGKFAQNTGGLYVITTSDTVRAQPQTIRTQGIPALSQLQTGWAAVNNELTLRNTGVIEELTMKVQAWYRAKVQMEVYTEDVNATYTWKLTGQYQW